MTEDNNVKCQNPSCQCTGCDDCSCSEEGECACQQSTKE